MSVIQNHNSRFWKDVLVELRRIPSIRDGIKLSKRDNETVSQAILLNAMILINSSAFSKFRDLPNLKRWCYNTKRMDIVNLDQVMKDTLMFLRTTSSISYDEFKAHLSLDNAILGAFLAPIRDILGDFLSRPNAKDFRTLNQFLSFMTRINLQDVDFSAEALKKYYANEKRIETFPYEKENFLDEIRDIVQEWFSPLKFQDIQPEHGDGGVAFLKKDYTCSYSKHREMLVDEKLLFLAKRDDPDFNYLPIKQMGECRTAEVVFVPKSLSSMRTICMEPTSLMYYQQGVLKQIQSYMAEHPTLSHRIRLKDQTHNQFLSKIGSVNQKYATIDLSAASDSVSWKLMEYVFRGTDYFEAALLTRSTNALLPDGNTIALNMFAPMGSTFCFPTQCVVFAAMCEYVTRKHGVHRQMSYSVYGDDIIIYEDLADELAILLRSSGFLLNEEKSYLTGHFKESCGGEYFQGADVTPLKIPRNYEGTKMTSHAPSLYSNVIDFANECNAYGFKHARNFLISRFESLPKSLQPLFDDGLRGISSPQATNFHLSRRTSKDLQIVRVTHGESKSPIPRSHVEDDLSLRMWLIQADYRSQEIPKRMLFKVPEDTIVVRTAPSSNYLRSVLTYDPCGSEALSHQYKATTIVWPRK